MRKIVLGISFILIALLAFAHEYILLAHQYRLQKGDDLEVHLFVSDGFNIQIERPFQKSATSKFQLITNSSITELSNTENGTLPIINRKVDFDGGALINLERPYARITLPMHKFLDYLREDHIEEIIPLVDKQRKEQKERYTRYIKCLVQSGNVFKDTLYKKVVGQNFEIVLLQNPYQLRPGSKLQVRVLYLGKPLANKIITARNRTGSQSPIALNSKTNEKGICSFTLARGGEWFIHATHMIPSPDRTDSDWESFWATYSFAVD